MKHIPRVSTDASLCTRYSIGSLLLLVLATLLGTQGCANRMAYGDRYVYALQLSEIRGIGRGGYDAPNVRIAKLDFIPIDRSDYLLKWTGAPITYANCYHFEPIIELEEPAPKTFTRDFDIMQDRWWFIADEMIGGFSVTFQQGSKVPAPDGIIYPSSLISSSAVPPGTPDPVRDKFWMGCTKKKKIKANADKDGEADDFYITLSPVMIPADGVTIGGVGRSPKHRMRCQSIGGGNGGGGGGIECTSMADCPRGDCAPGTAIGHYECIRGKCHCLPD